ncbi:MAG: hypothetical protein ACYC97_09710 [Metallibacterium sp.]
MSIDFHFQEEQLKKMYPYLYDLVCKGKLDKNELYNSNIINSPYTMVSEDLWDTRYIKEGEVGGKQIEFFTENNYNLGINYLSNSVGNNNLPATMGFLMKKMSVAITILIKEDLKFKIDIAEQHNGIIDITIPANLQEIIDNILHKTSIEFTFRHARMLFLALSDIAIITNMPIINTISANQSTLIFNYGLREEQIKEFDRYFFLAPQTMYQFIIKFPYELTLSKGIMIKLKLHGNKFRSV